jgi:hypothetical protein
MLSADKSFAFFETLVDTFSFDPYWRESFLWFDGFNVCVCDEHPCGYCGRAVGISQGNCEMTEVSWQCEISMET